LRTRLSPCLYLALVVFFGELGQAGRQGLPFLGIFFYRWDLVFFLFQRVLRKSCSLCLRVKRVEDNSLLYLPWDSPSPPRPFPTLSRQVGPFFRLKAVQVLDGEAGEESFALLCYADLHFWFLFLVGISFFVVSPKLRFLPCLSRTAGFLLSRPTDRR